MLLHIMRPCYIKAPNVNMGSTEKPWSKPTETRMENSR